MDLVDAISSTERVSSPMALSEVKPAFRRKFSSVYDVLQHAVFDEAAVRQVLQMHLPSDCQKEAGYEVYVLDATFLEGQRPRPWSIGAVYAREPMRQCSMGTNIVGWCGWLKWAPPE
jgi:hypothetical protein